MFRIILIGVVFTLSLLAFSGYSTHTSAESQETQFVQAERRQTQISNVVFTEAEFNELFLASLKADERGRLLLSVSDGLKVILNEDDVELSAVINMDKVEQIDPGAREIVENINAIFPFLENSTMSVTVYGEPIARNGQIGIKDTFSAKVGFIPLPNSILSNIGIDVARANTENLNLENLIINSVSLTQGQISFELAPKL